MSEWNNIGQILMNFGRITQDHVAQASEYQRENGGYFGEALLALGFVSQEELEWALASQFDLPYVFPDADTIDPEAAALVSPEWALAHLTLPIMKTAETLTVIVDSPMRSEAVDELQLRTDLKIEIALASGGKIRDLIRQVYARVAAREDEAESRVPVSLREAFGSAMDHGARRFGISARGPRALVWYKEGGRIRRRPLDSRWKAELEELVVPSPRERVEGVTAAQWSGHLNQDGIVTPLESNFLASGNGSEYLFKPVKENAEGQGRFPSPPQEFVTEVRLLARSGSARFLLTTDPPDFGAEILPHLPSLLLDPAWRSVHVLEGAGEGGKSGGSGEGSAGGDGPVDGDDALDGVFCVHLPAERAKHSDVFLRLHPFSFDVVTGDLSAPLGEWVTPLLNLAACAFVRSPHSGDAESSVGQLAREAGIRWEMTIRDRGDKGTEWDLHPLKG